MSTPTDRFANLSITSDEIPMALPEDVVKERAAELRDIFCTFDLYKLPSEFETRTFNNIVVERPSPLRLKQEGYTISGNIYGSIIQWGAYDEDAYLVLRKFQSSNAVAKYISETIERRFDECFVEYDDLRGYSNSDEIRDNVYRIAGLLERLSTAIYKDRQRRETGEVATLRKVLDGLANLCERAESILPVGAAEPARRSSRRTASLGDVGPSLFAAVVKQPMPGSDLAEDPFLLNALEIFSGMALQAHLRRLVYINGLLHRNSAPAAYIQRFEALQQKANEARERAPALPSGSGSGGGGGSGSGSGSGRGRGRGLEADPKPGQKRSSPPTTPRAPKRGKKGGA